MFIWVAKFGDASGKEPACQCRRCKRCRSSSWVGKIPWRRKWHPTAASPAGFPSGSAGKEFACQCRRRKRHRFSPWVRKIPGGGNGIPLQLLQRASPVAQRAKNLSANAGDTRDTDSVPGSGRSLEEEMATHSSLLAWKIPWTEAPGRLQSMALQRVGHD